MIEVSITDVLLFVWAAIATGYAFKYKEESHGHKFVIHKILSDDKVRDELVGAYKKTFGAEA